jgi:hypothetical protein
MLSIMAPGALQMAFPAMYGIEGPAGVIGWVIHMSHAAVIGLGFAALANAMPNLVATTGKSVGTGVVYGLVVEVLLAMIVMPIWLGAVGFPGAPPLPNIALPSIVGHIVYGAVLGAVYPALAE